MTRLYQHHGRARVTFYTHRGDVLDTDDFTPHPLISCSFTKKLGEGTFAGTMQLQLLRGSGAPDWGSWLRDDDWWVLEALEGTRRDLVSFGFVAAVAPAVAIQNGAMVPSWSVSGPDFARVLDDTVVWFCEWGNHGNMIGEAVLGLVDFEAGGPPHELCRRILEGFLGAQSTGAGQPGAWMAPPAFPAPPYAVTARPGMKDLLDLATYVEKVRGFTPIMNEVLGSEFRVSDLLREWSHGLLNECFCDLRAVRPGVTRPAFVLREKPFPTEQDGPTGGWNNLPRVRLNRTQITGMQALSRGGDRRTNVFAVQSAIDVVAPLSQTITYAPLFDTASIAIHGLRKLELTTRFSSRLEGNELLRWRYLLSCWWLPLPELYTGSLGFTGFEPRVRIGRILEVTDETLGVADPAQLVAYLTGVTVQWAVQVGWSTTMQVERGVFGGDVVHRKILADSMLGVLSLADDVGPPLLARTPSLSPAGEPMTCYDMPATGL